MAEHSDKLEQCEVCASNKAKYTCPKCEVRTCGLTCVNIHKKELSCNGIRDKAKFIPLNAFTDLDLLCDYRLLEEIGRSVENLKKNPAKKYTRFKNLSVFLEKLKNAAYHKDINLEFMPQNFSRHLENTTYLNWKSNEFFWRIELIFVQAENTKWTLERVLDSKRLSVILEDVLNFRDAESASNDNESYNKLLILQNKLKFYRSCGLPGLRALLKAEKVKNSDKRFFNLDLSLSLEENFKNKTIIEFPTIYIVFKDHLDMFEIIESDDEEIVSQPPKNVQNRRLNYLNQRNRHSNKEKSDSLVNYFFNSDITDSEDENISLNDCNKNKNQELYIPDYDKLVKM